MQSTKIVPNFIECFLYLVINQNLRHKIPSLLIKKAAAAFLITCGGGKKIN